MSVPIDQQLAISNGSASSRARTSVSNLWLSCRPSEIVLAVYFLHTALWGTLRGLPVPELLFAWLLPFLLVFLCVCQTRNRKHWSDICRDWASLPLILVGYWQVNWFHSPPLLELQQAFVGVDRFLLDSLGLRRWIESCGALIPTLLELSYLLLYTIPPMSLAALYLTGNRRRVDRFLLTLFLGAFTAYLLLPHFPTLQPRFAFPGADLPPYHSIFRALNVWLLGHFDIANSVFPSGHVAVAFSAAFGLRRAAPSASWLYRGVTVLACLVFLATFYGRYHYSADGFASLTISFVAWKTSEVIYPDA